MEQHRADVNLANHNRGTCLINAVKYVDLCRYLLDQGANLNARDVEGRNVLYYAIDNVCLDTVKLLLDAGVDPVVKREWGDGSSGEGGETALQLACLRGDQQLVECILERISSYTPEQEANGWELLGATQIVKFELRTLAFNNWRRSIDCRQFNRTPKKGLVQRTCYSDGREFMTHVELDRIQEGELEQLLLQSALVTDRILGIGHEETRFRIMRLGAKYADSLQYQRYISLWGFCLRTRVEQQSLFNFQTCFTAEGKPIKLYKLYDGFTSSSAIGLVRVLLDLYLSQAAMNNVPEDARLSFADVFQIYELLATELEGECILQRFQFGRKVYNFSVFYSIPKTAANSSCVQETATEL